MYKRDRTQKEIAETIGKDKSVISRELKRNANPKTGKYTFDCAKDLAAWRKKRMKIPRRLHLQLKKAIIEKLMQGWSPEQITSFLKRENKPSVSHEAIYRIIRKDRSENGSLYLYTRHKLKRRKRPSGGKISIKNHVSIEQRPEIVNAKTRFGDWETDAIVGENNRGAIVTIVERKNAFMMMEKRTHSKNAKELAHTVIRMLTGYKHNVHTITSDNVTGFADHQTVAGKLKTQFFFTHPYSSWEKRLIENTNKLIRQYIPEKANFNNFSDQKIKEIQYKINSRPGKNLNFIAPLKIFSLLLHNHKLQQMLNLHTIRFLCVWG